MNYWIVTAILVVVSYCLGFLYFRAHVLATKFFCPMELPGFYLSHIGRIGMFVAVFGSFFGAMYFCPSWIARIVILVVFSHAAVSGGRSAARVALLPMIEEIMKERGMTFDEAMASAIQYHRVMKSQ